MGRSKALLAAAAGGWWPGMWACCGRVREGECGVGVVGRLSSLSAPAEVLGRVEVREGTKEVVEARWMAAAPGQPQEWREMPPEGLAAVSGAL